MHVHAASMHCARHLCVSSNHIIQANPNIHPHLSVHPTAPKCISKTNKAVLATSFWTLGGAKTVKTKDIKASAKKASKTLGTRMYISFGSKVSFAHIMPLCVNLPGVHN